MSKKEFNKKDLEKQIEVLAEDNDKLRKEVDELKNQVADDDYSDFQWAETLNQDEIDSIVKIKIAKEMLDFYVNSGIQSLKIIERVIDFHLKNHDVEIPKNLKKILSIGLRIKIILPHSIEMFLNVVNEMPEDEIGFYFDLE